MGEELTPLFVRLSIEQGERLDRAVTAIDARKKDLIAGLIDQYVDPDSPTGLEALRAVAGLGRGELGAAEPPRHAVPDAPAPPAAPVSGAAVSALPAADPRATDRDSPELPILTPAGAAALLAIAPPDLLELAEHGELPARRIAGQWRFARAALIAWVAGAPGAADDPRATDSRATDEFPTRPSS